MKHIHDHYYGEVRRPFGLTAWNNRPDPGLDDFMRTMDRAALSIGWLLSKEKDRWHYCSYCDEVLGLDRKTHLVKCRIDQNNPSRYVFYHRVDPAMPVRYPIIVDLARLNDLDLYTWNDRYEYEEQIAFEIIRRMHNGAAPWREVPPSMVLARVMNGRV